MAQLRAPFQPHITTHRMVKVPGDAAGRLYPGILVVVRLRPADMAGGFLPGRIFSSFPEPAVHRMLWSWLSFEDCVRLVGAAFTAPRVGFTVAFGISDNRVKPVDNSLAGHLGFYPEYNTETFRAALEARLPRPDPKAPAFQCLGGWFVDLGHPDDEAKSK